MSKGLYLAKSFKIAIANLLLIVLICSLVMTPLWDKPGALHPLLMPPFLYFCISFIPALAGLVFGVIEKVKKKDERYTNYGIALNLIYFISYVSFVFWFVKNVDS